MTSITTSTALLACLTAAGASAQISGSVSSTTVAQSSPAAGGASASASFAIESTVAQVATGPPTASVNYRLESGVAWTSASLGTDAPIVLGVSPAMGDKVGGQQVSVIGANFTAPGAGSTAVHIGGAPGAAVQVAGGTVLTAIAPVGVDAFGNPLGLSDVDVTNAVGSAVLDDGFLYTPAIAQASPTTVGGLLELDIVQPPGAIYLLWIGFAAPDVYIPLGTWEGSLAVMSGLTILAGPTLNPTGAGTFALPIPDDRGLGGVAVDFQAISITDLFASVGSFTNLLKIGIEP